MPYYIDQSGDWFGAAARPYGRGSHRMIQERPEPSRAFIRALQGQIEQLADGIPGVDSYRVAAAWVYMTCLHAWAEDHGLIDGRLRGEQQPARKQFAAQGGTDLAWLVYAVADIAVHPCAWPLLDPAYDNPVRHASPSDDGARRLLDWWASEAPTLAYPVEAGPDTITGWLPGDLLQLVTDERRQEHALVQTPWWLAGGILDRTLIPAAREFVDEPLQLIDPTCGTGHFLVVAVEALWELYTTGSLPPRQMHMDGVTGWTPVTPREAARRILAGVHGVELDPITAAVARLRVTITVAHLLHQAGSTRKALRLDAVPHNLVTSIVVGDALLAGKVDADTYARARPDQARIVNLGHSTETEIDPIPGPPLEAPTVTPIRDGAGIADQLALFT